jgi:hypothetical protein
LILTGLLAYSWRWLWRPTVLEPSNSGFKRMVLVGLAIVVWLQAHECMLKVLGHSSEFVVEFVSNYSERPLAQRGVLCAK